MPMRLWGTEDACKHTIPVAARPPHIALHSRASCPRLGHGLR